MAISESLKQVVEEKATRLLKNRKWRTYGRKLAQELGCENEKAFLAGAIDGMIFDMAAVSNPRRIPSHEERQKLIKEILKSHGLLKT